jgi:thiamine monophosphate synthase
MGGSSGGGSFSSKDVERMEAAAEARLKALASKSTKVVFVCEDLDRQSLESRLARSQAFLKERVVVIDSAQPGQVDKELGSATFLVAFTNEAKAAPFINDVIDKAMEKRIGIVHVQAHSKTLIPSKISAYRLRSVTWSQLESIFE